ncbi:hypothetical protein HPB52_013370 [Rhipicephalus sanguineus]|uniref:Uncharacterized protein n=1 Tax=Rhipicephalus sanguineus TaxID=34632 RepID=A0A9D4SUG5_RHISA|nr:hypothetical protein HPB52_013370 [Rhipicephalus sanguineus]
MQELKLVQGSHEVGHGSARGVKDWPYSFSSRVGIVDTHCHLDFLFRKCRHRGSFADFRKAHAATFPKNYEGCVSVFCDPETFKKEMPVDWRIHRHCFTGEWTEAQQWRDAFPNLCIGLTPLLGFRNAGPLVRLAARSPWSACC